MTTKHRNFIFYSMLVTLLTFSLGFSTAADNELAVEDVPTKEIAIEEKDVPLEIKIEKPVLEEEIVEAAQDITKYYQVISTFLNVREQPSHDTKIKDVLVNGWVIESVNLLDNGWIELKTGGYINSRYTKELILDEAQPILDKQNIEPKPQPVFAQPKPTEEVSVSAGDNINTSKNETQTTAGFSASDIDLLARLVRAEAQSEPYEGKVAVAIVVLNRIDSEKFPDTMQGVIYQSGQFSPVSNGSINRPADDESRRAVNEALNSSNRLNGSLFFYNPEIATSRWLDSKTTVAYIGDHVFKK